MSHPYVQDIIAKMTNIQDYAEDTVEQLNSIFSWFGGMISRQFPWIKENAFVRTLSEYWSAAKEQVRNRLPGSHPTMPRAHGTTFENMSFGLHKIDFEF